MKKVKENISDVKGYISAMGYSTACDWLFIASEGLGNNSLPVGDRMDITVDLKEYRIVRLGGGWFNNGNAGGFYWYLMYSVGLRGRSTGGSLGIYSNT
jgi:hypothetical protein